MVADISVIGLNYSKRNNEVLKEKNATSPQTNRIKIKEINIIILNNEFVAVFLNFRNNLTTNSLKILEKIRKIKVKGCTKT